MRPAPVRSSTHHQDYSNSRGQKRYPSTGGPDFDSVVLSQENIEPKPLDHGGKDFIPPSHSLVGGNRHSGFMHPLTARLAMHRYLPPSPLA